MKRLLERFLLWLLRLLKRLLELLDSLDGRLAVPLFSAALLVTALLVGCVSTTFVRTVDPQTLTETTTLTRRALFYDTEFSAEVPGWGTLNGYKGNSDTQALLDMFRLGATIAGQAYGMPLFTPAAVDVLKETTKTEETKE